MEKDWNQIPSSIKYATIHDIFSVFRRFFRPDISDLPVDKNDDTKQ